MDFAGFCLHFLAFKPCTGFELACPSSQAPDFGLLGPLVNAAQGANGAKHSPTNRAPAFGFACPRCQAAGFGWPEPPAHAAQGGPGAPRFAKKGGFAMVLLTFRANCAPAFGLACPRCQAPGFGWPGPPGHAFWGGKWT